MFLGTFLGNKTAIVDSLRCLVGRISNSKSPRSAGAFVFTFLSYAVSGAFGLLIAGHGTDVTLLWPPTAISLAALLILGRRFWPAVFLGAFVVNVATTHDLFASLGIALGNALEALAGAYLIRRYAQGTKAFFQTKSVIRFVFFAGVLATAISATIGVSFLCYSGLSQWRDFESIWLTWWEGDAVASIVMTPFLVLLLGNRHHQLHSRELGELLVLLLSLTALSVWIFGPTALSSHSGALVVLCIPFLMWAAYRFCPLEAAGANFILCGFLTWSSLTGHGPLAKEPPLLFGLFIAVATSMTLVISAFQFQRRSLEEGLTVAVCLCKSANSEMAADLSKTAELLDAEVAKNVVTQHVLEMHRRLVHQIVQELPRIIWVIDVVNRQVHYVDPLYQDALSRSWERLCSNPRQRVGHHLALPNHGGKHGLLNSTNPLTDNESSEERYHVVDPDGTRTRGHQVTYALGDGPRRFHYVSIEATKAVESPKTQQNSILPVHHAFYGSREEGPVLGGNESSGD